LLKWLLARSEEDSERLTKVKRLSVKMKDYWGSRYIKKKKSVTNERKTLRTEDQTTIKKDKTLKKSQRH